MTAVLFTCAGQRVDIVTAFGRAGARTLAVDVNPLAPALYHADAHAFVPRVDDPGYVPALQELIRVDTTNPPGNAQSPANGSFLRWMSRIFRSAASRKASTCLRSSS